MKVFYSFLLGVLVLLMSVPCALADQGKLNIVATQVRVKGS